MAEIARDRRSVAITLALVLVLAASLAAGCGAHARFALRPALWRDGDDRDFAPAPAVDEETDIANTIDVTLLRPLAHWMLFERAGEAWNVNALDEVADSSWFTNRAPSVHELEEGACTSPEPEPPFTVSSTKVGGTTAGFVVTDASGTRYVVKLDGLAPRQPQASTAADAIVSRLYWAAGFNVPCNRVVYVAPDAFVRGEHATERFDTGERAPLSEARLDEILARATPGADGLLRVSTSQFIEGQPLGTWRAEGTRHDDPNDVIPHEDRRELRGERFLAAWVGHWDSRGPQSFDTFVRGASADPDAGHVVHYFLDFSESLGGTPTRTRWAEPRMGHETVSDLGAIALDAIGFGLVRRPWDEVAADPRYPDLGYFDDAHFDPEAFSPQTPLVRWERAQAADLGWMARRIARIDLDRIAAAVRTGRWSDGEQEARLVELLFARRQRVLRAAFSQSSPLADAAVIGDRFCAFDLAVETATADPAHVHYALALLAGPDEHPIAAELEHDGSLVCARMHHFAPDVAPDDDAERYAILVLDRTDDGAHTTLRAHFYDLGLERGFVLVGLERP